jgi:aryl-alcohol dehydrogenase-like predicted oxidoreductase
VIQKSITRLGAEYVDVLLLGWRNKRPRPGLLDHACELKEKGLIRFLALSGHNRLLFPQLEKDRLIDIFHVRYNAAHRGAEREIFGHLPEEGGPGIVSFTNTRWGALVDPASMPPGEPPPSPADCYRFVLSHPRVHVAVCGPNSMKQLREDLECLRKGPMNDEELRRMHRIGDHVYGNVSPLKAQLRSIRTIRVGSLRWP